MSEKLICPVCDRPEIDSDICPNCETNLSALRMLKNLPKNDYFSFDKTKLMIIIIFLIILGLILTSGATYFVVKRQFDNSLANLNQEVINQTSEIIHSSSAKAQPRKVINNCGGFYYRIKSGDSLSNLALFFYGDSNLWRLIIDANSNVNNPNQLTIAEKLFIPNLPENCSIN